MSIPALNNTSDYDVYTKKYLQSLNLQVELNKKNFDANYAFQKTGVQETERPDMRPIEERMADVEKLKVQARMMLNKVTDANNANQIMEYLLKNSNILFFFIQNFPSLEAIVKQQFSGGILASQMISLIYKSYLKYTDEALIPDSDDYRLVSSLVTQDEIKNLMDKTDRRSSSLYDELRVIINDYPTQKQIDTFINNPEQYVKEIHELAKKNKNGLTRDDINPLIDAYNDRKILTKTKDEQTIYQTQEDLINKIQDLKLKSQPPIEGEIVETKKVPEKALVKPPTQKKKQLYTPEEQELKKRIRYKDDQIKRSIQKSNRIIDKIKQEKERERTQQLELEKKKMEDELEAVRKAKESVLSQLKFKPQSQPQEIPEPPQFGTGIMDAREKHIHRFKVLKGEILAGNTNSTIIKELKSLVVKMIKYNELEPPQALMILKELNNIK